MKYECYNCNKSFLGVKIVKCYKYSEYHYFCKSCYKGGKR